jgi:hypothetical protein
MTPGTALKPSNRLQPLDNQKAAAAEAGVFEATVGFVHSFLLFTAPKRELHMYPLLDM